MPVSVRPSYNDELLKHYATSVGACAGDVENFCASVTPGEARLGDCLSKQQDEEAKGNTEGALRNLPIPVWASPWHSSTIHTLRRSLRQLIQLHNLQGRL